MSDKQSVKELTPATIQCFDVFEGEKPSKGEEITYVYCPTGNQQGIFLYGVGRHMHPGIYEFAQIGMEVIPSNFDATKLGGGRIVADRKTITSSPSYSEPIPDNSLEVFKDFVKKLDSSIN